jgi:hypothetical protein
LIFFISCVLLHTPGTLSFRPSRLEFDSCFISHQCIRTTLRPFHWKVVKDAPRYESDNATELYL